MDIQLFINLLENSLTCLRLTGMDQTDTDNYRFIRSRLVVAMGRAVELRESIADEK